MPHTFSNDSFLPEGTGKTEQGIWETTKEYAGNLADNPWETATGVAGVALGAIGVVGSGAITYLTGGGGSPWSIPAAAFSANTVVSSAADLKAIATGNMDDLYSFNPAKDGIETVAWGVGEVVEVGVENVAEFVSDSEVDIEIGDYTESAGTGLYYLSSLYFETKNVSNQFGKIMDNSYKLQEVTSLTGNMTKSVNNVTNAEKTGAVVEVLYQIKAWWDNYSPF